MNPINLLEAPIWVSITLIIVLCLLMVVPPTLMSLRASRTNRGNDNTSTAGLRLSGSALVLISGFLAVQNFQLELQHDALITKELQQAEAMLRTAASASAQQQAALNELLSIYAVEVRTREFTHMTGLPHLKGAFGDPKVDDLMRRMNPVALEAAVPGIAANKALVTAYRSFRDVREQRVSFRELLPPVLIWVLLLCGASTLVLAGAYPSGPSGRLKWLQSLSATLVVATLLSMQVVIVSPQMATERRDAQTQLLREAIEEAKALTTAPAARLIPSSR